MHTCAHTWDNDLVDQKEEQMKPIETTKRDKFGCGRTFVIGRDDACGGFDPETAAPDRIEILIY